MVSCQTYLLEWERAHEQTGRTRVRQQAPNAARCHSSLRSQDAAIACYKPATRQIQTGFSRRSNVNSSDAIRIQSSSDSTMVMKRPSISSTSFEQTQNYKQSHQTEMWLRHRTRRLSAEVRIGASVFQNDSSPFRLRTEQCPLCTVVRL